jgi:Na+/proline symporter
MPEFLKTAFGRIIAGFGLLILIFMIVLVATAIYNSMSLSLLIGIGVVIVVSWAFGWLIDWFEEGYQRWRESLTNKKE